MRYEGFLVVERHPWYQGVYRGPEFWVELIPFVEELNRLEDEDGLASSLADARREMAIFTAAYPERHFELLFVQSQDWERQGYDSSNDVDFTGLESIEFRGWDVATPAQFRSAIPFISPTGPFVTLPVRYNEHGLLADYAEAEEVRRLGDLEEWTPGSPQPYFLTWSVFRVS